MAALCGCAHPAVGAESFEEFLERNPDLLDSTLIEHFYSRELILAGQWHSFQRLDLSA
jgi:hypothetical protein